jgi:hypothetical protein
LPLFNEDVDLRANNGLAIGVRDLSGNSATVLGANYYLSTRRSINGNLRGLAFLISLRKAIKVPRRIHDDLVCAGRYVLEGKLALNIGNAGV